MELDLTDEQVKAIRLLESIGCTIIFNGEIRKDSVKKMRYRNDENLLWMW